ncbi:MAG: 1-acyl-sn-glycerol-3-phosphate acyltransferase [Prevotella sp.]|nr:1-acyl-sn-glycerol-3-phosphate acyltransferase [Prevotella sp.]
MINNTFDDIRPYYDEEIPEAMRRIAESQALPVLSSFVFPHVPLEDVKRQLLSYKTIRDFQLGVMYHVNKQIISNSITKFSYDGHEQLQPGKAYLYVSNHRDIMLDASLLQNLLVDIGLDTTQITFGANLMMNQLVIDIGKSNKMFRVERPGNSIKEFYKCSVHLSEYIRDVITRNKESVWIAQRNGRTKDGNDQTDQGIIKMFCMSKQEDKIKALSELNIVPISVSYEWESCDILKAIELYESRSVKYIKKPGEDLNSILTGILQKKGRVHFQFCPMIKEEELTRFNGSTNNEYHKQVAELIDSRIQSAYRLWPNNYIAHDIQYGQQRFIDKYTPEDKAAFEKHLAKLDKYEGSTEELREILLGIYANPINNKEHPTLT